VRRRPPETPRQPAPRPCGHQPVTVDGETAPSCAWGQSEELAIPLESVGTQEHDAIEAALAEHEDWQIIDGRFRWVRNEALLGPAGRPWGLQS
jgi:hypothetical protein